MSYLGNKTFRITPQVSYTHVPVMNMTVCLLWVTKLSYHTAGLLHLMFQAFHLRGLTTPFLLHPTHVNCISLYALNRESFIRHRPKYELTTHSSTLMMDYHTHAHTPNMLMSLCICNANVTIIFHVTLCDAHYMNHSHQFHFMSITMQTYIASILKLWSISRDCYSLGYLTVCVQILGLLGN